MLFTLAVHTNALAPEQFKPPATPQGGGLFGLSSP